MTNTNNKRKRHLVVVNTVILEIRIFVMLWVAMYILFRRRRGSRNWSRTRYTISNKVPYQINHLRDVVGISDDICRNNLRMPIQCFHRLCFLLENIGGLRPSKHVSVVEKVCMFLSILSHHKKNVTLQTDFKRSGHTVSVHFNHVLNCVIKLYQILLVTPKPVPENCNDDRWKHFKVSLSSNVTFNASN